MFFKVKFKPKHIKMHKHTYNYTGTHNYCMWLQWFCTLLTNHVVLGLFFADVSCGPKTVLHREMVITFTQSCAGQ